VSRAPHSGQWAGAASLPSTNPQMVHFQLVMAAKELQRLRHFRVFSR
jgi:hypothetical protein